MNGNRQIEDIIKMLDSCVTDGVGHINLQVNPQDGEELQVESIRSNDCSLGNQACAIPNMHNSVDEK